MKGKIFLIIFTALLVLNCCAGAMKMKFEEKAPFEGYSREEVLNAATEALIEMGYTISLSDRDAGIIQGVKKSAIFTRSEGLFITIMVSEIDGVPNLQCQVDKSRAVTFTDPSKLTREIIAKTREKLKK